ncbi:MAG: hypothetical protein LLG44_10615, partial [Chloroflexi bacterium]|nr:hypothetical protein [Chloroflexota bacterium]
APVATPTAAPTQPADPSARPTQTPEPLPAVQSEALYSQLSVRCAGGWSGSATLWVGGTEQSVTQGFELDNIGRPAALWTLWNQEPWLVTVRLTLPEGLDPNRWKFIQWIGNGPEDYVWTNEATVTLGVDDFKQIEFQLVDTAFWK